MSSRRINSLVGFSLARFSLARFLARPPVQGVVAFVLLAAMITRFDHGVLAMAPEIIGGLIGVIALGIAGLASRAGLQPRPVPVRVRKRR